MATKALPKIVSDKVFRSAVEKLRIKEKKNTRERDKVSAQRRRLPMTEMQSDYIFEGPEGKKSLLDLFEGRKQLVVYHFMYHPKDIAFAVDALLLVTIFRTWLMFMREIPLLFSFHTHHLKVSSVIRSA